MDDSIISVYQNQGTRTSVLPHRSFRVLALFAEKIAPVLVAAVEYSCYFFPDTCSGTAGMAGGNRDLILCRGNMADKFGSGPFDASGLSTGN